MDKTYDNNLLKKHLLIALLLGFVARELSAYFVFGPQALDDYLNQLIPSFKYLTTGSHGLPAWRSPLVIWIFSGWLKLGTLLNITIPVHQVQWVYSLLNLMSLSCFFGCYYFFKSIKNSQTGIIALYMTAVHGLMPFISTRSFLESICIGPLTLGVGLLLFAINEKNSRHIFLSLLLIGFATLIRFQVGIVLILASAILLYKNRKHIFLVLSAGFIILAAQTAIELLDHRAPFSTLIAYANANKNMSDYGREPWFSSLLTWLVVGFFPISILLLKKIKSLLRTGYCEVLILALGFVIFHSCFPHKEERFIYPVVGISLWLWAELWNQSIDSKSFKYFTRPVLLVFNTIVIIVGCFINVQVGEIGVPAKISSLTSNALYIDRDSLVGQGEMWEFFIRDKSKLNKLDHAVTMTDLDVEFKQNKYDLITIMTSNPEIQPELENLHLQSNEDIKCTEVNAENSVIDNLIYKMNPKKNQRRKPTWFIICHKPNSTTTQEITSTL